MKRTLGILLGCSLFAAGGVLGDTHVFTSSDGLKTLEATLMDYDSAAKTVDLRLVGGKRLTAPLTAFSSADAEYVAKENERLEVGRKLGVRVSDRESEATEVETTTAKTKKQNLGYSVNFRNNGTEPMEGVTARYRIFYSQDQEKGGGLERFEDGELKLSAIAPREDVDLETEMVELTTVRGKRVCST